MDNSRKCVCGAKLNVESLYCTQCGNRVPSEPENFCTNPECIRGRKKHSFNVLDTYCDICGKPTHIGEQALRNL